MRAAVDEPNFRHGAAGAHAHPRARLVPQRLREARVAGGQHISAKFLGGNEVPARRGAQFVEANAEA